MKLQDFVREIPDFPKPGIMFKDITPLLLDPRALEYAVQSFAGMFAGKQIDKVAGIEARGFCFGAPLALKLAAGFVPLRKPGKLPWKAHKETYQLEYGSDALEAHQDAISPGERVLIVDDLLATGGTAGAAARLVQRCGGQVLAVVFVVELLFLEGRARNLKGYDVRSLIQYE